MSDKQTLVSESTAALKELGVSYTLWEGTDVAIHCEFLDASWGSGSKKIQYDASVLFDEAKREVFMWEMTKESSDGLSFGSSSESTFQSGKTLSRKVKSVQYGLDGIAYDINLDIGAIAKVFKETAQKYGWKFQTVIKRDKALYADDTQNSYAGEPIVTPREEPILKKSNGILFWILFGALAMFDAIMIIGGSGTVFTLGALVVLALLIVLRKFIGTGLIKTLLLLFLASIVTFVIFATTVTTIDSEKSVGNTNAVSEGFSRTVNDLTLAPTLKTTTFTQLDEVIYFSVLCNKIPENSELVVKWYLDGALAIEVDPEVFPDGLNNQYYTTMIKKGDNPFPVGEYKIEFVISKDGVPIFTAIETCEVVPSK